MKFNISLELAAVIFLIVIAIFFFKKKKILDRTNKIFGVIIITAIGDILLDICSAVMANQGNLVPVGIQWVVSQLFYFFQLSLPVVFVFYILSMVDRLEKKRIGVYLAMLISYGISLAIWFSNYWTGCYFYFIDGQYHRGSALVWAYGSSMLYLCIGVGLLLYFREKVSRTQVVSICAFVLLTIMSIVIQFFISECLITGLALALAIMITYMNMQNPENYVDQMTRLYNRQAFLYVIGRKTRNDKKFGAIVVVLDDFKSINRIFGLRQGDKLMCMVAEYLRRIGGGEPVFRYTGDQFILLTKDEEDGETKTSKVRRRFERPFILDDLNVELAANICYVPLGKMSKNVEKAADLTESAVAMAKHSARGTVSVMDEKAAGQLQRQMYICDVMKKALDYGGFEVYYQPIFSVKENRMMAAEALIRLKDEDGTMIWPDEFIPLAEKDGQILAIGEFVLNSVCQFIKSPEFSKTGLDYIEINVSVIQCMQKNYDEILLDILDTYGVEPEKINFEITETAMAVSEGPVKRMMERMYASGIRFSMDDFGSGYSNLGKMQEFPFSMIKLDKEVFWQYCKDSKSLLILKALTVMIRTMRKQIVVEGVETPEHVRMAKLLKVGFLQGYYYSKPLQKEAFVEYMKNFVPEDVDMAGEEINI